MQMRSQSTAKYSTLIASNATSALTHRNNLHQILDHFGNSIYKKMTIEKSKIADLVLLDTGPLQDVSNMDRIAPVVFGDRLFDKTTSKSVLTTRGLASQRSCG